ncbi:hypothetical protein D3C77_575260 [compost metagenome]
MISDWRLVTGGGWLVIGGGWLVADTSSHKAVYSYEIGHWIRSIVGHSRPYSVWNEVRWRDIASWRNCYFVIEGSFVAGLLLCG